ncbi:hypothetical protein ANCDUO_23413, partial [Ancylostoma duodenale]
MGNRSKRKKANGVLVCGIGKKKAFLDKKNAVHFRLVPKSAAESGPEEGKRYYRMHIFMLIYYFLELVKRSGTRCHCRAHGHWFDIPSLIQKSSILPGRDRTINSVRGFIPTEEHLEEQHKYGIFFDDDYDYMQHLRDVRETGTLQTLEEAAEQEERFILRAPKFPPPMPSALFGETSVAAIAKKEEEEIFDEDVEKALEGNFEGEIEGGLEDDFIALAGGLAEPVPKSQIQHRQPAIHIDSDEE